MRPAVKIDDLTDSLVMVSPESTAWLDRETGRVWIIANSTMAFAEGDSIDEEELSDWHEDELAAARLLLSESGRGIELPTAFDFHEYRHMERFLDTLPASSAARPTLARHQRTRRLPPFQRHRAPPRRPRRLVCLSRQGLAGLHA